MTDAAAGLQDAPPPPARRPPPGAVRRRGRRAGKLGRFKGGTIRTPSACSARHPLVQPAGRGPDPCRDRDDRPHGIQRFVIDYGVLWSSRRQAQNAADAGAHGRCNVAGLRGRGGPGAGPAERPARPAANPIWGQPPDITPADVTFPDPALRAPAPADQSASASTSTGTAAGGSPLPSIFGTWSASPTRECRPRRPPR